ncbi:hypothetical protein TSUD_237020 [Trifolium subterraneum]|uniref:Uncharacterized protein n=1 Tax=Trifolium subterraneum TaxID=3900 RepID=A0A2Z6NYT0_TRISU|nr:hypothetical protein TSUD_237020 [Trifolium subterraneum]
MSDGGALLGHKTTNPNDDPEKSKDEKDLHERSTKKKKDGEHIFSNYSSRPIDYSDVVEPGSEVGKEDQREGEEVEGESMRMEELMSGWRL